MIQFSAVMTDLYGQNTLFIELQYNKWCSKNSAALSCSVGTGNWIYGVRFFGNLVNFCFLFFVLQFEEVRKKGSNNKTKLDL